jgi:anaerobic selenocysteine-containing dehydrogenase
LTEGAGRVRALVSFGANPVVSSPDGAKVAEALGALDFMLSFDIYLNETTLHADVILPAPSLLETSHYDAIFSQLSYRNMARYNPPIMARAGDQPEEWQSILRLIAITKGMGAGADLDALDEQLTRLEVTAAAGSMADAVMVATKAYKGPERLLDIELRSGPYGDGFGQKPDGLSLEKLIAAENGIDLGPLEPRMPEILRTPSGKIELAPQAFLDDLCHVDITEMAHDGLMLIGRRDLRSNNSWMHNLPILAKGPNRCTLLIHPEDARAHNITDGAMVELCANAASIVAQACLSDEMMRGVLSLPHGWGHDQEGSDLKRARQNPGVNTNLLIPNGARDPLSGNSVLNGIKVTIRAA